MHQQVDPRLVLLLKVLIKVCLGHHTAAQHPIGLPHLYVLKRRKGSSFTTCTKLHPPEPLTVPCLCSSSLQGKRHTTKTSSCFLLIIIIKDHFYIALWLVSGLQTHCDLLHSLAFLLTHNSTPPRPKKIPAPTHTHTYKPSSSHQNAQPMT